ncbi:MULTISPECIES: DUF1499 domain-containing protein [Alteribacter]|uniref:DUF1499 domain-containing protein n=1 Tax=Alteribacter keqinensis TaxID=2483800 RepID=A0A3M7TXI6_9BACI|nr:MULTISPECIES: DUF1499 domain-containing protein [Alteribacter]MBM7096483.1 DUF1499 domain-containing protein [Alteribacter salitolerans]RNA70308.1 DUF1499 domain-containing protein [Alteribacter keqinensis]
MGFRDTIQKYISTHTETREKHPDEKLQTHYYKSSKDKVMKEVQAMINQRQGLKVQSVSEERGEIIVRADSGKKIFLVATVIMVRPYRTAVDFSVTTETVLPVDFGYSRKLIYELYKSLNGRLTFVGAGLGDNLTQGF